METISFHVEYGLYGATYKPLPGALWRASFYDRVREQFYAGSADDPFEAIAWALVEREMRILNGNRPMMSRADTDTPASYLTRIRSHEAIFTHIVETDPYVRAMIADVVEAITENGTIQKVNKLDAPQVEPKKPAAARRARAKKG